MARDSLGVWDSTRLSRMALTRRNENKSFYSITIHLPSSIPNLLIPNSKFPDFKTQTVHFLSLEDQSFAFWAAVHMISTNIPGAANGAWIVALAGGFAGSTHVSL